MFNAMPRSAWFLIFSPSLFAASPATTGQIFDAKFPLDGPVYSYTMQESREGGAITWNSRFLDRERREFAVEQTVALDGKLVRYSCRYPDSKEETEIKVSSAGISFRQLKEGIWKENWEKFEREVVAGPLVVQFIRLHWDALLEGKKASVRLAVPTHLETIGFRFQKSDSSDPSKVVFEFAPSSFFVRLIVGRVKITLDAHTRKCLRIEGPSFLKKKTPRGWEDLVADYRFP